LTHLAPFSRRETQMNEEGGRSRKILTVFANQGETGRSPRGDDSRDGKHARQRKERKKKQRMRREDCRGRGGMGSRRTESDNIH